MNTRGEIFLLAQGSGMTRPYGGAGMCGAGVETDVVWLHIGATGRVRAKTMVWVESCANQDKCRSYRYDPRNLAKGLVIVGREDN